MAQCYRIALRESREASHSLHIVGALRKADAAEVAWLAGEANEFVAMLVTSVRRLDQPVLDESNKRGRGTERLRRKR
jgi:hypothetical protein